MKLTLPFATLVFIGMFASCSSEIESTNNTIKEDPIVDKEIIVTTDTVIESIVPVQIPNESSSNFTIQAEVDGPDSDLFFLTQLTDENLSESVIDIVPYVYEEETNKEIIEESLMVIARDEFRFFDQLSTYTGQVNMYYDQNKKHLMTFFNLIDGKPEGWCVIKTPNDEVYLERNYINGNLTNVAIAPFATKWNFDQENSSLIIEDNHNALNEGTDGTTLNIMSSFYSENEDNTLDKILEKASFAKPFTINEKTFSGKLMAFQHPIYFDETPRFELNFKDGLLHGDIKIYSWWGGALELHETFKNGQLVEQVYVMDESDMDGVAKPIIYLYPEKITDISVQLDFNGDLTHTYPKYPNEGWKVTAHPDGTLFDKNNKEYYALYWEGEEDVPFHVNNGNIIKGSETVEFLEHALTTLGLNAKESNEFIIYWLPHLESTPYNLIHFSTEEYEAMAQLKITPTPETIIRVMMVFEPLESKINIPKQDLNLLKKERKGFTVVEWGGSKLKHVRI